MTWGRWRTRQRFITWTILLLRNKLPCFPTFCRCFLKIHRSKPMFSAEKSEFQTDNANEFPTKICYFRTKTCRNPIFEQDFGPNWQIFPGVYINPIFSCHYQNFIAKPAKIRYFSWKLVEIGLLIQYFGQNGLFWITAPSSGTGISVKSNQSYELFNA